MPHYRNNSLSFLDLSEDIHGNLFKAQQLAGAHDDLDLESRGTSTGRSRAAAAGHGNYRSSHNGYNYGDNRRDDISLVFDRHRPQSSRSDRILEGIMSPTGSVPDVRGAFDDFSMNDIRMTSSPLRADSSMELPRFRRSDSGPRRGQRTKSPSPEVKRTNFADAVDSDRDILQRKGQQLREAQRDAARNRKASIEIPMGFKDEDSLLSDLGIPTYSKPPRSRGFPSSGRGANDGIKRVSEPTLDLPSGYSSLFSLGPLGADGKNAQSATHKDIESVPALPTDRALTSAIFKLKNNYILEAEANQELRRKLAEMENYAEKYERYKAHALRLSARVEELERANSVLQKQLKNAGLKSRVERQTSSRKTRSNGQGGLATPEASFSETEDNSDPRKDNGKLQKQMKELQRELRRLKTEKRSSRKGVEYETDSSQSSSEEWSDKEEDEYEDGEADDSIVHLKDELKRIREIVALKQRLKKLSADRTNSRKSSKTDERADEKELANIWAEFKHLKFNRNCPTSSFRRRNTRATDKTKLGNRKLRDRLQSQKSSHKCGACPNDRKNVRIRVNSEDEWEEGNTPRPDMSPEESIKYLLRDISSEHENLQERCEGLLKAYMDAVRDNKGYVSKSSRKRVVSEVQRVLGELDRKEDQLYALRDFIDGEDLVFPENEAPTAGAADDCQDGQTIDLMGKHQWI